jgi:iron complex transport system substrate-binding protein
LLRSRLGKSSDVFFRRNRMAAAVGAFTLGSLLLVAKPILSAAPPGARSGRQISSHTVVDGVGRRVEIPAALKRVVSLAPDLTETIYALGLEEKLAGDTNYCDTPPAAKLKPHVGTAQNPSLEAIIALRPDLVFASTSINRRETVDELARLGLAVYATNPHTVRGVLDSIENLASVMGSAARGQMLAAQLRARLDALAMRLADLPPAHVLFVVWENPLITIGQNTFIADALRWAGAESVILADQNWPQISSEEVVRLQPDYIVFTSNHSGGSKALLEELRSRQAWKGLHAVEMGRVLEISDEIARPSAGLIAAIEQLAREVHPEAFTNSGKPHPGRAEDGRQVSQARGSRQECTVCVR